MLNLKKKLSLVTVTLGITCGYVGSQVISPIATVYAIRPTQNGDYEDWNPKDPASWSQNMDGNPKHLGPMNKKGAEGVMYDGSGRFPAYACMIFAYTFMGLKAGAIPIGTTPADVHDHLYDTMKSQGWTVYSALTDADMWGVLEFDPSCNGYQGNVVDQMKKDWEDGYLILPTVAITGGSHQVCIDKIENGKIYILDSGNWGTTLDDHYGGVIQGYYRFKMKDGTKGKDLPVISDHPDGSWANGKKAKPSKSENEGKLTKEMKDYEGGGGAWNPDEGDIPNMPKDRDYDKAGDREIPAASKFDDGSEDGTGVAKWKEERKANLDKAAIDKARKSFMLIGFVLLGLSVLFSLAFMWDIWNPFGILLLPFFTRGKLRAVPSLSSEEAQRLKADGKAKRFITTYNVLVYTAIMVAISVFIMSGYAYAFFSWVSQVISDFVSYVGGSKK